MKKVLFALVACMCSLMNAYACNLQWNGSTGRLTMNFDLNQEGNTPSFNISDVKYIEVKGTFDSNQWWDISNRCDQQSKVLVLDMSDATPSGFSLTEKEIRVAKLILPNNTQLPANIDALTGLNNKWNANKNLLYVCALQSDGTLQIAGGVNDDNSASSIKAAIEANEYPFNQAQKIELFGGETGKNYTIADKEAIVAFNSAHAVTTFENGTLKLASNDLAAEIQKLKNEGIISDNSQITEIVFPDGTTWKNGEVTSTSVNIDAMTAALKANGFEVNNTQQNLGHVITIKNGVVVVNVDNVAEFTSDIEEWNLTSEELTALRQASSLKIVGDTRNAMGSSEYCYKGLCSGLGYGHNITSLDLSEAKIDTFTPLTDDLKNGLTSLLLPTDPSFNHIPDNFCDAPAALTSLDIPANVKVIGKNAFDKIPTLTSITLHDGLEEIGFEAFTGCSISEISIPGTVKEIHTGAFFDCHELAKVVFNEHLGADGKSDVNMHIETQAFRQVDHLLDVFINTHSAIRCDNEAFDFAATYGHADTGRTLATLHYPEEFVNHYVNLGHLLTNDIASNEGKFHLWLLDHFYNEALKAKNGWWEFVQNGSYNYDIPYDGDVILRTFSDYHNARLVPEGVKAYIVNKVEYNNDEEVFELTLKRLFVIPANTGVILYGQPNSKDAQGNHVLVMPIVHFEEGNGQALSRDNWDKLGPKDQDYKNYLMPISTPDGSLFHLEPYDKEGKTVTFRNFALNRYSETTNLKKEVPLEYEDNNYAGFFRVLKGNYPDGYAYLHLSALPDKDGKIEYDDPKGAECVVIPDENYTEEIAKDGGVYDPTQGDNPNHYWEFAIWNDAFKSWGDRTKQFGKNKSGNAVTYLGELEDGVTDSIEKVAASVENSDEYYTLQGVKVANPTKGVYIRNGKKVIVK